MALHGRFCAQIGHFRDGPMLAEEDPEGERSCEKDDELAEVHRKR